MAQAWTGRARWGAMDRVRGPVGAVEGAWGGVARWEAAEAGPVGGLGEVVLTRHHPAAMRLPKKGYLHFLEPHTAGWAQALRGGAALRLHVQQ